jgi:phosphoglucomutase
VTVKSVATVPIEGQRPGTSGLRKKTRIFMQPGYLENFIQSAFNALQRDPAVQFSAETLVVGGDGRYYNRSAIQTIVRMAAANGFSHVMVGRGGLLSTPAMSAVIRRRGALGGFVLSASHNPGGIDQDFGVKYNVRNGGPAPEWVTEGIYQQTQSITGYRILDHPDIDLDREGALRVGLTRVTIFDPLEDYTALMRQLFDFAGLRHLFESGFRMLFDAMHGITGPYARHILEELIGAPQGTVMNGTPLEDFGGRHPDPNLVHAAELVRRLSGPGAPDFGAACDGDGDRNLILGRDFFVTPGDSLAVIAEHARSAIPGYRGGLAGIARSMPTSMAADRVAAALGVPIFETPTGWKFFGNLMDAGLCTICGEESFGTGSNHVREKDGLWAVLAWLSILAATRNSVSGVVDDHWKRFGRSYFQRHDYEALEAGAAAGMIAALGHKLHDLAGRPFAGSTIARLDDFSYTDPVDGSVSAGQGIRIFLTDGSRAVCRLSGTGTEGATLRVYLERYDRDRFDDDAAARLAPMAQSLNELLEMRERCHRNAPTVIT